MTEDSKYVWQYFIYETSNVRSEIKVYTVSYMNSFITVRDSQALLGDWERMYEYPNMKSLSERNDKCSSVRTSAQYYASYMITGNIPLIVRISRYLVMIHGMCSLQ